MNLHNNGPLEANPANILTFFMQVTLGMNIFIGGILQIIQFVELIQIYMPLF